MAEDVQDVEGILPETHTAEQFSAYLKRVVSNEEESERGCPDLRGGTHRSP